MAIAGRLHVGCRLEATLFHWLDDKCICLSQWGLRSNVVSDGLQL